MDEFKKHDKVWMYDIKSEKYNIPCTVTDIREKGKSYYATDIHNNRYLRIRKCLKRRTDNRDIGTKPKHKNLYYSTRRAKQAVCIPNLYRLKMWQRVGVPSHKAEVLRQDAG